MMFDANDISHPKLIIHGVEKEIPKFILIPHRTPTKA